MDAADVKRERPVFVCPHCTGDSKKRKRVAPDPSPRALAKLVEVPDKLPPNTLPWRRHQDALGKLAAAADVEIINLPNKTYFTDAVIEECIDCCSSAIRDATFSESYPRYCLREIANAGHAYLQGSLLRCKKAKRVVALVLSNGMDPYGNIRTTLATTRKTATAAASGTAEAKREEMLENLRSTPELSDLVHFTLIATHPDFRGHGYAKMLMVNEMLKWVLRGRNRAFLNMALEKHVNDKGKVYCTVNAASQRLYEVFGFMEVAPKYGNDGEFRYTAKEADMGRVMANVDMPSTIDEAMIVLAKAEATAAERRRAVEARIIVDVDAESDAAAARK